jgi:hypothetical protein
MQNGRLQFDKVEFFNPVLGTELASHEKLELLSRARTDTNFPLGV